MRIINKNFGNIIILWAALSAGFSGSAFSADVSPPTLVSWSRSPATVNTTNGSAQVTVQMRILDDESGADFPNVSASHPSGQSTGFAAISLVAGVFTPNGTDATYEATLNVPQGSAPGLWEIILFPLVDLQGNVGRFGPGPGYENTFTVIEDPIWIAVGGNVDFEGIPICALVLINGQRQFSCDGNGRYDMQVPVAANGMITVQVFADGFAPFNQIVTPDQAAAYPVAMAQDQGSRSLDVGATYVPSATEGRFTVSGSITIGSTPVCALVLANGQSMFSCGGSGQYSLDVPLDQDGNVTLMVFAAGFKPYKVIAD